MRIPSSAPSVASDVLTLLVQGANDAILNVDGLTCYEGLNISNMNQKYDDYEAEDYMDADEIADQQEAKGHHEREQRGDMSDLEDSLDNGFNSLF